VEKSVVERDAAKEREEGRGVMEEGRGKKVRGKRDEGTGEEGV